MKLKDDLAIQRHNTMSLRARGLSTKPVNLYQREIQRLHDLCITVTQQRDDIVRMLDKAKAHIKFLEEELRAKDNT